jgi:hypothetical protein
MYKSFIDRLLLPAIFGLTTLIVALVLWQRLVTHRRAEMKAAAKEQASFVKTKTESELRARVRPLERLAGRWHSDEHDMDQDSRTSHGIPLAASLAASKCNLLFPERREMPSTLAPSPRPLQRMVSSILRCLLR